jgi:uncharacterized membrane protein
MDIGQKLKGNFISGLLIVLPLLVSLFIIKLVADYALILVDPIIANTGLSGFTGSGQVLAQVIALLIATSLITLIGYLSGYRGTERISDRLENLLKDIPVFGSIYSTIDQISDSFSGDNSKFKELVLVEFPREDLYSLGLITSEAPKAAGEATGEEELKSVYIPYSPNPTMGNLVMVPESDCQKLDLSVQKGMKLLLTTGIAYEEDEIPEEIREVTN